ncbi:hypothetical protein DIS24_g5041 [Lasiodiplodia hormozganensis]|uniref:Uncharacterized protein n=1 Tax=Lasiodiplodia hormozganensis TaxID=869390 RepID=A0AA39YP60_9PEZI|nr:hypothetical protein DIS24_g5041 [Lasiodiplodia hormozganensis]
MPFGSRAAGDPAYPDDNVFHPDGSNRLAEWEVAHGLRPAPGNKHPEDMTEEEQVQFAVDQSLKESTQSAGYSEESGPSQNAVHTMGAGHSQMQALHAHGSGHSQYQLPHTWGAGYTQAQPIHAFVPENMTEDQQLRLAIDMSLKEPDLHIQAGPSAFAGPSSLAGPSSFGGSSFGGSSFAGPSSSVGHSSSAGLSSFAGPSSSAGLSYSAGPSALAYSSSFAGPSSSAGLSSFAGPSPFAEPSSFAGHSYFAGSSSLSGPSSSAEDSLFAGSSSWVDPSQAGPFQAHAAHAQGAGHSAVEADLVQGAEHSQAEPAHYEDAAHEASGGAEPINDDANEEDDLEKYGIYDNENAGHSQEAAYTNDEYMVHGAISNSPLRVEEMTEDQQLQVALERSLNGSGQHSSSSPQPTPATEQAKDAIEVNNSLYLPLHQLFLSIHQINLPIDTAFDQFMGFLAQAYPGQIDEFIARRQSAAAREQQQQQQSQTQQAQQLEDDDEDWDSYQAVFEGDHVFVSHASPTQEPPAPVSTSGGQQPAPFVSLVDIEGPAREALVPSLSVPDLEAGEEAGVVEGGETVESEEDEGEKEKKDKGKEKKKDEDDDDDEDDDENGDGAALPASIQSSADSAANTSASTSGPAGLSCDDDDDDKDNKWKPWEIQAAGRAMRWVLDGDPDSSLPLAERYRRCAARMEEESGVQRTWTALRSAYARVIRAATGVDERKRPKPHRLQTSVQKTGARSAACWKAAAVAADAGKAADEALKREKKRKLEEEKEENKREKRRKKEEEEEKRKGKRRRVVDEEEDDEEEAPRRSKRVRSSRRSSESPLPGGEDKEEEVPAAVGAVGEGSASARPNTRAAQVAADAALARRLQQEETANVRLRRTRRG